MISILARIFEHLPDGKLKMVLWRFFRFDPRICLIHRKYDKVCTGKKVSVFSLFCILYIIIYGFANSSSSRLFSYYKAKALHFPSHSSELKWYDALRGPCIFKLLLGSCRLGLGCSLIHLHLAQSASKSVWLTRPSSSQPFAHSLVVVRIFCPSLVLRLPFSPSQTHIFIMQVNAREPSSTLAELMRALMGDGT